MRFLFIFFFLFLSVNIQGQKIIKTFDSPADNITGLSYDGNDNALWAVSKATNTVYKLNTDDGKIISSFKCNSDGYSVYGIAARGKGAPENELIVGYWNNDSTLLNAKGNIKFYSKSGEKKGEGNIFC